MKMFTETTRRGSRDGRIKVTQTFSAYEIDPDTGVSRTTIAYPSEAALHEAIEHKTIEWRTKDWRHDPEPVP